MHSKNVAPSSQRILVVRNLKTIVTVVLLIAASDSVYAQPPTYAPYGAWRGRIRYVEGPWRTKSTVRWGNGITPVGGQVLIQGLTSAEAVFTNPSFLGTIAGLRDAQPDRQAESRSEDIEANVAAIRASNVEIAKLNASILDRWGLKPTRLEPIDSSSVGTGEFAPSPDTDINQLIQRLRDEFSKISQLVPQVKKKASLAVAYADFLDTSAQKLRLSETQGKQLKELMDYAWTASREVNAPPTGDLAVDDPLIAVRELARLNTELMEGYQQFSQIESTLRRDARALETYPFRDAAMVQLAGEAMEAADRIAQGLRNCGQPPVVPADAFAMVSLAVEQPAPKPAEPADGATKLDPFAPDPQN
jgi:hypothetical protein